MCVRARIISSRPLLHGNISVGVLKHPSCRVRARGMYSMAKVGSAVGTRRDC